MLRLRLASPHLTLLVERCGVVGKYVREGVKLRNHFVGGQSSNHSFAIRKVRVLGALWVVRGVVAHLAVVGDVGAAVHAEGRPKGKLSCTFNGRHRIGTGNEAGLSKGKVCHLESHVELLTIEGKGREVEIGVEETTGPERA